MQQAKQATASCDCANANTEHHSGARCCWPLTFCSTWRGLVLRHCFALGQGSKYDINQNQSSRPACRHASIPASWLRSSDPVRFFVWHRLHNLDTDISCYAHHTYLDPMDHPSLQASSGSTDPWERVKPILETLYMSNKRHLADVIL